MNRYFMLLVTVVTLMAWAAVAVAGFEIGNG